VYSLQQYDKKIQNEQQLREILGHPSKLANNKVISFLDDHCKDYIRKTPFIVLSTSDANGFCDASPRGDAPGFIKVLDDTHFFIPERPGNKRLDSILNILENPQVGLLLIIPGLNETLRINGEAIVTNDKELLELAIHDGKAPQLGILVRVRECYMHCGKAFIRSSLWNPDSWPAKEDLPIASKILADHASLPDLFQQKVAASLQNTYTNKLY
jgi:PPOX class probable FMN-dependent enzyme